MTRKPPNCCKKKNLHITALLKTESPVIIPTSMNSGKKATLNPLTQDDVASLTKHRGAKEIVRARGERRVGGRVVSQMSSAVCSILLISPIGMPSPLHVADQLPLYIASLYLCECAHGHVRSYASKLKPDRSPVGM